MPFRRWTALLALLIAEGLGLGVAFDSDALDGLPSSFALFLVRNAGSAVRVGSVVLACFFLVAGAKLRRSTQRKQDEEGSGPDLIGPLTSHRFAPYLLAHLATFAALAAVTVALYGHRIAAPGYVGALLHLWLLLLVATLASWVLTLVPPRALPALLRQHGDVAVISFGLGATALGMGKLSEGLWYPLRRLTFALSSFALGLFEPDYVSDPSELAFGTQSFVVDIAPQCSGYEGMGLTVVFLLAALWFFRERLVFPRAWWLLPVGAAVSFLANIARVVALILVGTYISPEIGQGGFHSYAGTLLFCGLALSIVALAVRSPVFSTAGVAPAALGGAPAERAAPNPVAPFLVPFLAMIAASLVARSFSSAAGEPLYPLRPIIGIGALAAFWRVYRRPEWREAWRVSWFAPLVGLGVGALWLLLSRLAGAGAAATTAGVTIGPARALTMIVVVPLAEELAFRGFLARRVSTAAFESLAPRAISLAGIAVSSVAFGLLHARIVPGIAAGVVYALAYRARGRLADAVLAHALTNAVLLVAALVTGDPSLAT